MAAALLLLSLLNLLLEGAMGDAGEVTGAGSRGSF
jgi:hypothetical protein